MCILVLMALGGLAAEQPGMNELWGKDAQVKESVAGRGQRFDHANYAMFIHWGLYSQLANRYQDKTYYGIGEWLMNRSMAGIDPVEYRKIARDFKPDKFDARAIAKLARDAGMAYIIITSKHHDGFAMYDSDADDFNVVDATPWKRDPMKELAQACREQGLGFGFYYSHNQDWTAPGGNGGPKEDADGNPASFEDYFKNKCLPQVEEITSRYGDIELVWFDTPGRMPKQHVEQLVEVVRKNQPKALISGRAGHGLGDYRTLGDMELPVQNVEGLWESVDTTNDSWGYAWYDENWKTPDEILQRLITCVARGGTYMLNIGPKGDGSVPERAAWALEKAGEWIEDHPEVIRGAGPSPWGHALPWGDVTTQGKRLHLCVFDWPRSRQIHLPGVIGVPESATLFGSDDRLKWSSVGSWLTIELPALAPDERVSVITLDFAAKPQIDAVIGVDPDLRTELLADFATVEKARSSKKHWMEKFGEWKAIRHIHGWSPKAKAVFEVEVKTPGDYAVSINHVGEGRLVWEVSSFSATHCADHSGGAARIRNQQGASAIYHEVPLGWLSFPRAGSYRLELRCLEGDLEKASFQSLVMEKVRALR